MNKNIFRGKPVYILLIISKALWHGTNKTFMITVNLNTRVLFAQEAFSIFKCQLTILNGQYPSKQNSSECRAYLIRRP